MHRKSRNWIGKKINKLQEIFSDNAAADRRAGSEREEASSADPRPIAPTNLPRNIDQGTAETRLAGSTAPEVLTPKEHKDAAPRHVQVRTSTVGSLSGNEQKEDLPMNTEPVIPTTGRSQANQESAPQASSLETFKGGPATPAKVELSTEGGILNNSQGVHFAGSTTLNSTQIHNTTTHVYNTVQPDVSEKGS
ncbi:hypothetical protein FA15DRAFT_380238 [Coprinopsis marcescibilis]|uniref:Uncharacterized protein n=1 Tax=Coprinopsis marcescibilis TaxID=230819 RepID=A0A5C3KAZ5_COPMA|nr:hypothetical protein FA15DRAFT_380238 [Coprinopsis marcescibilis]